MNSKLIGRLQMKLFVAKLNRDAVESDLLEWFGAMGPVRSVKVVTDRDTGQSKCFGFVEMETKEGGEKAITEMNGQEFMGFRMVVKEAEDRPRKPREGGVQSRSADSNPGGAGGRGRPGDRPFSPEGGGPGGAAPSNRSFKDAPKSRKSDKKKKKGKPDKYADGPRDVKLKRRPKGGGGSRDWGALDDDY